MKFGVKIEKAITVMVLCLVSIMSYAQENDNKLKLYLNLGVKYVAIDDYARPLIGLTLEKKLRNLLIIIEATWL